MELELGDIRMIDWVGEELVVGKEVVGPGGIEVAGCMCSATF